MNLPDKAYYRPDEIAVYFDISVSVLYQWIEMGTVNAVKVAGKKCVRISRAEVERMKVEATEA